MLSAAAKLTVVVYHADAGTEHADKLALLQTTAITSAREHASPEETFTQR